MLARMASLPARVRRASLEFACIAALAVGGSVSCSSSQCAAACAPFVDVDLHSDQGVPMLPGATYAVTVSGDVSGTLTCDAANMRIGGPCNDDPSSAAFTPSASVANGSLLLQLMGAPVRFDISFAKDGTELSHQHFEPTYYAYDVCGETCHGASVTMEIP